MVIRLCPSRSSRIGTIFDHVLTRLRRSKVCNTHRNDILRGPDGTSFKDFNRNIKDPNVYDCDVVRLWEAKVEPQLTANEKFVALVQTAMFLASCGSAIGSWRSPPQLCPILHRQGQEGGCCHALHLHLGERGQKSLPLWLISVLVRLRVARWQAPVNITTFLTRRGSWGPASFTVFNPPTSLPKAYTTRLRASTSGQVLEAHLRRERKHPNLPVHHH
mmetsp:Transcript_24782/g.54118  ORF Transcript_24782/g.54118 Transcript_24782/m.54118 type:complete len:218 (+) Transcript_24782:189-842(+)